MIQLAGQGMSRDQKRPFVHVLVLSIAINALITLAFLRIGRAHTEVNYNDVLRGE